MDDQRADREGGRRLIRLLLFAVIMLLVGGCGPSMGQLESSGNPIIKQIEAYNAEHGEFPDNLAKADITLPDAPYGGWEYHTSNNNSEFVLRIGDYGRDNFVFFWDSRYGSWYLDD